MFRKGEEITTENGAMGEFIEVYDVEMKALEVASKILLNLFNNENTNPPSIVIISTDNTGALQRIFQGSPGKAQTCSLNFWRNIINILDKHANVHFALTWCPGHFDIDGNEKADKLAKSGSYLTPMKPNYKSLSYLGSLHKHKIGEEWRHRWANNYTTLCSKFHITNHIPPTTHPMNRFLTLDQCTFSQTIQCCTGHTHIGEYYQQFVPNEEQECHCRKTLQTQNHLLFKCKAHQWHWCLLGTGETQDPTRIGERN